MNGDSFHAMVLGTRTAQPDQGSNLASNRAGGAERQALRFHSFSLPTTGAKPGTKRQAGRQETSGREIRRLQLVGPSSLPFHHEFSVRGLGQRHVPPLR